MLHEFRELKKALNRGIKAFSLSLLCLGLTVSAGIFTDNKFNSFTFLPALATILFPLLAILDLLHSYFEDMVRHSEEEHYSPKGEQRHEP